MNYTYNNSATPSGAAPSTSMIITSTSSDCVTFLWVSELYAQLHWHLPHSRITSPASMPSAIKSKNHRQHRYRPSLRITSPASMPFASENHRQYRHRPNQRITSPASMPLATESANQKLQCPLRLSPSLTQLHHQRLTSTQSESRIAWDYAVCDRVLENHEQQLRLQPSPSQTLTDDAILKWVQYRQLTTQCSLKSQKRITIDWSNSTE